METRKTQQEFYDFVWDKKNWNPPTPEQLREFLGVTSNQSVYDRIYWAKRKGLKMPYKYQGRKSQ